jgi:hypothetical protein
MSAELLPQGYYSSNSFASNAYGSEFPMRNLADDPANSTVERQTDLYSQMPSSWRPNARHGQGDELHTGGIQPDNGFDAIIPSAAQYERYNATAGSARLALPTRWKSPVGAMQENFADRRPPPIPIGTGAEFMNDSDARQSMVYNSTGFWPSDDAC